MGVKLNTLNHYFTKFDYQKANCIKLHKHLQKQDPRKYRSCPLVNGIWCLPVPSTFSKIRCNQKIKTRKRKSSLKTLVMINLDHWSASLPILWYISDPYHYHLQKQPQKPNILKHSCWHPAPPTNSCHLSPSRSFLPRNDWPHNDPMPTRTAHWQQHGPITSRSPGPAWIAMRNWIEMWIPNWKLSPSSRIYTDIVGISHPVYSRYPSLS